MADVRFHITDVFATEKYSGNQLATVFHDGKLTGVGMQRIAFEFGFSETTFIMSEDPVDGGFPVRIFTPEAEIPFAGHPTLGTAYVIARHVIGRTVDRIDLDLGVGRIPVECSDDGALWMRQNQPEFEDGLDPKVMAAVLGLAVEKIDSAWPISQVTTGLPFTIVPLADMESLKRTRVDMDRYVDWVETVWAKGILVFCRGGYADEQTIAARVFVPYLGVPEDPATGSANGCLAGYLLRHRCLRNDAIDIRVGQGYEIGRPSEIFLRAKQEDEGYEIHVGGHVIEIASGVLHV